MSSSKIYKDDPIFTPVSLVQHEKSQEQEQGTPNNHENTSSKEPPQEDIPSPVQDVEIPERIPAPEPAPDLETLRNEAFHQGKNEAEQVFQNEFKQTLEAFTSGCQEVDGLYKNLLEQSRGDMINLIIALSKKIIGRELDTTRDTIAKTLEIAIEQAIKYQEYDIWLNPQDLSTAEHLLPDLIGSVQQLEHINLKTDPNISPGGCKLDSPVCMVDATIEAQLETVAEFLEENEPACNPAQEKTAAEGKDAPEQ